MEPIKQKKDINPFAVWALGLALLGFAHPLFGFIAIFMGVTANMQIKNNEHVMTGQVMATIAIIMGIAFMFSGRW